MTTSNRIIQGDCLDILKSMPSASADFILTDPPYFVRYRDRDGRIIANDVDPASVLGAFDDLYRILKPNRFCVCFYGWSKVGAFFDAWTKAGFKPVAHLVWHKDYASKSRYVRYTHEQAYVLAKGNPRTPESPIEDVQPWEYSGNRLHPTEKAVSVLQPLVRSFSEPGDLVLDPFAGSGSSLVAAALAGRSAVGIELEEKYCTLIRRRLSGMERYRAH